MKISFGRIRASSTKAIMMAKASKTPKTAKPVASANAKPKAARKPAAPKKAKKEEPAPEPVFHNETRLFFKDDAGRQTVEEALPLIDAVASLGNIKITSACARDDKIDLHAVKPGHPEPYAKFPGVILTIDFDDSSLMFDHFVIGYVSPELIDDAATSLIDGVVASDGTRQPDWYERGQDILEDVVQRHAQPSDALLNLPQAASMSL